MATDLKRLQLLSSAYFGLLNDDGIQDISRSTPQIDLSVVWSYQDHVCVWGWHTVHFYWWAGVVASFASVIHLLSSFFEDDVGKATWESHRVHSQLASVGSNWVIMPEDISNWASLVKIWADLKKHIALIFLWLRCVVYI